MKHYEFGRPSGKLSKILKIAGIALAVVIIGLTIFIRQVYYSNIRPLSGSARNIVVSIPSGATVHDIAENLQKNQVIRSAWAFEWYIRTHDSRNVLQAGTYNLRQNQSVSEIVTILTRGKIATNLVTILPGQRLDQIKSALINNAGFSAEEVEKALNPDLYADEPALTDKPVGANLEGYLYPDSYQKASSTTAEDIIRASLKEMHSHLTPDTREAIVKQGLTIHQGVTLASIITQEAGSSKDMPLVAQVFLLRLRQNMPLEADPTAVYGALKDGIDLPDNNSGDAIRAAIGHDSLYNTYKHGGLPPGPISNATVDALKAIASPSNTDYLYFVAGDDGVTHFSRTLEEHESLTREYCKTLCGP